TRRTLSWPVPRLLSQPKRKPIPRSHRNPHHLRSACLFTSLPTPTAAQSSQPHSAPRALRLRSPASARRPRRIAIPPR
uniref:Uncharacterized protein n=1 Tax=Aegilops tauschii subsp. strangulata TaxID=200361 RepID=A0A453KJ83_AEGTS